MSRYIAAALAASALALPASAAERKFDAEAAEKVVAPYLDERTVVVLHVDLTAVDLDALVKKAADLTGTRPDRLPAARKDVAAAFKALRDAGARDFFLVVSLADVPERPPFAVVPLGKDAHVKELTAALQELHPFDVHHFTQVGDALVGGEDATVARLRGLTPAAFPDLAKALAAAHTDLAQLAVVPPKEAAKVIEQLMPTLPAEVGGGPSTPLTRGFRWAAIGVDAPTLRLTATVQAADADSARALLDLLRKTCAAFGKTPHVHDLFPDFNKLTDLLTPKVMDDRLELNLDEKASTDALRPLLANLLKFSEESEAAKQMEQLVRASQKHLDANGTFPAAATCDKQGKPLLSWRVRLLPYLGEEKLYKEFHLDEPWDSEHNKKLIEKMPAVFRSTGDPKLAADGKTTFLAPLGDDTMFPPGRGVRIGEVTDGTANTILFVQADDDWAVEWTKPQDLEYDAKDPMKGLGNRYDGGFMAAFASGDVHFLPRSITKDTLRALFTRSGGEAPGPDFRP
jgi:hypothetical protein